MSWATTYNVFYAAVCMVMILVALVKSTSLHLTELGHMNDGLAFWFNLFCQLYWGATVVIGGVMAPVVLWQLLKQPPFNLSL